MRADFIKRLNDVLMKQKRDPKTAIPNFDVKAPIINYDEPVAFEPLFDVNVGCRDQGCNV